MSRGHYHPKSCKVCGRHESEVGRISATGLCIDHAVQRAEANHRDLKAHSGDYFDHWRRRCLASFGVMVETDER